MEEQLAPCDRRAKEDWISAVLFEVWLGIRFIGAQFEKIDVTNELDTVST